LQGEQRPVLVNGLPGILVSPTPGAWQTIAFRIEHGSIREIYTVRNPDKLQHVVVAPTPRPV
jgi:RNA polymerase sigma-70 factor (ECF subfamily)